VRPFWGRFFGYYGGTLAALYLTGAIGVFIFLRVVGYPISIVHVVWPPSWHRVPQARGWYFSEKAQRALNAGHTAEGLLYLSNAYEFDPRNYGAGLLLAKTLQSGQPVASNRIYERLYHEHVPQREGTAEEWFRALLARGDFVMIQELARDRLAAQTPHASAWMRALIFATRQSSRVDPLKAIATSTEAAFAEWRPLVEVELLFQSGNSAAARAKLRTAWWNNASGYAAYYRISELTEEGDVFTATDLIAAAGSRLDAETRTALELAAYAHHGAQRPLQQLVDAVLGPRLSLAAVKVLTAQLIRQPDQAILDQLFQKLAREPIAFSTESAGVYFSLLCAAGAQGDWAKFNTAAKIISDGGGMTPAFQIAVESFFRGRSTSDRAVSILPVMPLPLENTYAMIERYPGRRPTIQPLVPRAPK
jgi:hypothetical protein